MRKLLISALVFSTLYARPATAEPTALPIPQGTATDSLSTSALASANARNFLDTRNVFITAYSSSPDETDSTPFITASGEHVRDGIVATNMLPFGTRIVIPAISKNKIFTVEDRMSERFSDRVDIWMRSKSEALRFGIMQADIVILQ